MAFYKKNNHGKKLFSGTIVYVQDNDINRAISVIQDTSVHTLLKEV